MHQSSTPRVAVVGGGIAGLAGAYELQLQSRKGGRPLAIDLYEASHRLGGAIYTEREDDWVLDAGPDAILTLKPWALDLCREIGLEDEIIPTREEDRGVALYSRGRLRPLPYGTGSSALKKLKAYVTSGVVSWPAKLRMGLDLVLPRGDVEPDMSMSEFFERRLGREAVERIVDPLIAGIYSGDPDKLSIQATFPRFPQMVKKRRSILLTLLKVPQSARSGTRKLPVFCSLEDGLGRIVERLRERMDGVTVRLNSAVTELCESDGRFEVSTAEGHSEPYAAVLLAVPAWTAAQLLRQVAPGTAGKMEGIRYVSSATVFFAYRAEALEQRPRGYGFLVPTCEGRRINGATWITNKFDHRSPEDGFLARCFIGGDRTSAQLDEDDAGLVRICREELREIAGIEAEPLFTRVFRWRSSGPQYDVGHESRVREIDAELAAHPGLDVTGSGFRGIGIPDCIKDGREAAGRLLSRLKSGSGVTARRTE